MKRTFQLHPRMPTPIVNLAVQTLTTLMLSFSFSPFDLAHSAAPINGSGLNTQVSQPVTLPTGQTQYDITGGTRPGGGTNLFHSFGDFNIPTNNIASFFNDSGLATSNILGRVTAGNPSIIFGEIQTNEPGGFGNANLFLVNPAGFLFGPNSTINVGGMVAFTTADYLRFQGTDTLFNSASTPDSLSPLSIAPVAAFGFLGSNPAAIAVQGSTLQLEQGQSLSLVGGNRGFYYTDPDTGSSGSVPGGITMTGGKLLALGGQINIASIASPGEMSAVDFMPAAGMTMGDINLSLGALLDVSAEAAGTVRIRGGQFVIDGATVSADTNNAHGADVAIHINVTSDMSLANDLAPALTARTTGSGNAGAIQIQSGNLEAITSSLDHVIPLIDAHTSGTGTAGSVAVETGNLRIPNHQSFALGFFLDTGTAGTGQGGDVSIQGSNIFIDGANIATGNKRFEDQASGSGGNLSLKATESLEIISSDISTQAWFARAGNITLEAPDIFLHNGTSVTLDGDMGSPTMSVDAGRLRLDFSSRLLNNTVVDPGGDTTINARVVELTRDSFVQTSTLGDGKAGNIILTATERLTIDDRGSVAGQLVSGLISSVLEESIGSSGGSGSITVTTPQVEMFGGGIINTTTRNSGDSGDVSIFAHSIAIFGERLEELPSSVLELGSTRGSGIYTRTVGSDLCAGICGNAGNINIMTESLNLEGGGTINSGTTNTGAGGKITINATDSINISGATTNGTPSGIYSRTIGQASDAGSGGNIALTAAQSVTLNNGSSISASSTGPGNAGNISINAGQQLDITGNSSVETKAEQASGGNIDIQAVDRVHLVNSSISTSVLGGAGSGGNITIDPDVVVLQNSHVIAQAVQGAGGNITITTPLFLADFTSLVSASSQLGLNGTVTIQSPTSNLSGSLGPLTSTPSQAQALLTQRCAALASGQASSFVVAGREQLPSDPGGWLTSPLAFAALGESLGTGHAASSVPAIMPIAAEDTGTVSLRRLTPAGFLMANFADSEATGCRS